MKDKEKVLKELGIRAGFYKIADNRCNDIIHTDKIISLIESKEQKCEKEIERLQTLTCIGGRKIGELMKEVNMLRDEIKRLKNEKT